MGWRTYLVMYFGTIGAKPSEIGKRLESIGFNAALGNVDFVYDWKSKKPTKDDVLALGDKVAKTLEGSGAVFNLDTHD